MPRRAALVLLLLGSLAASAAPLASAPPSPPSLAGRWQHRGGAAPEQYVATATADALVYNASCVANGCTTWQRATVSVTDAAARAALIVFTGENGRNHTGLFAQDWAGVTWSDGSAWERPPAPQPLAPGVTGVDVVVMPHTHDDAGWQRTFEGYYEVEVTPIINNVVAWLTQNLSDSRVFNWVESSFLQRWWLDQNSTTRATFAQLVALRRIVFVGGGWTMHDEESTNPYSAATNMEYGLTWLQQTFGAAARPRVLWQPDPSGHALLTPTLAALLGFDALFIDRVPGMVRTELVKNQSLQFVWTGVQRTADAPAPAILASILDSFYCTTHPAGDTVAERVASFASDILRRSWLYRPNATGHITILWPWGCDFAFQNLADFDEMTDVLSYIAANTSALPPGVTARFGSINDFVDATHAQATRWPTQGTRDFHPYRWCYETETWNGINLCYNLPTISDPAYWRSGMFTSKVALKGESRWVDASLHAGDALFALAELDGVLPPASAPAAAAAPCGLRGGRCAAPPQASAATAAAAAAAGGDWAAALGSARAVSSLMTHHDAITGTAYVTCSLGPPYVDCDCFTDYMVQMHGALNGTEGVQGRAKAALLSLSPLDSPLPPFVNATVASAGLLPGGMNELILAVGNPLGWARREVVRFLLQAAPPPPQATVFDLRSNGVVASQVVSDTVRGSRWLYFLADVPPLSIVAYSVLLPGGAKPQQPQPQPRAGEAVTLSNGATAIVFDASGRLASWQNVTSGRAAVPLLHDLLFYAEKVAGGDLIGGSVYGFEPVDASPPTPLAPPASTIPVVVTASGPLVWEATQLVSDYAKHTVRLFAPEAGLVPPPVTPQFAYALALPQGSFAESQTRLGPLPSAGFGGGSYVAALTPGAGCGSPGASSALSAFITDASGFQVLRRPPFNATLYAQGQVYPSWPGWDWQFGACDGSGGGAGEQAGLLAHVLQRPTGAAVFSNTSAWTMLHRRLLNPTDPRGNDSTIADDAATLFLADGADAAAGGSELLLRRQVQARLVAHPLTLHGAIFASSDAFLKVGAASYTPAWLTASLPPSVLLHSLTTRDAPWYPPQPNASALAAAPLAAAAAGPKSFGLRLQQLPHAPPASVDVAAFLGGGGAASETTLDFNADKAQADAKRLSWLTLDDDGDGNSGLAAAGVVKAVRAAAPVAAFEDAFVRSYVVNVGA